MQRVVGQARQEARPQPPCRRFPALCGQRYGLHIGQGRHVPAFGGQPRLPCLPGGGIGRRQYFGLTRLLQPGRAVGGEIGRQAVGLHGQNGQGIVRAVYGGQPFVRCAADGQRADEIGERVTRQQSVQRIGGIARKNVQRNAERGQPAAQFGQCLPQENALAGIAVGRENKRAHRRAVKACRNVQGGVVVQAQVAVEMQQGEFGRHREAV